MLLLVLVSVVSAAMIVCVFVQDMDEESDEVMCVVACNSLCYVSCHDCVCVCAGYG